MPVIGITGSRGPEKGIPATWLSVWHTFPLVTYPLFQPIFLPLSEHFRLLYKTRDKQRRPGTRPPDHRALETLKKKGSPKLVALKPTASENLDASESNSLHCQEQWRSYNELLVCSRNSLKLTPLGPQRKS